MYIRNYHEESHGSGKNKRTERVYTGTATKEIFYNNWTDFSGPIESLEYLKQFGVVAFQSHLILHIGP